MKKFSLLGLVLIIGLFASCTPTVGHICTVFDENIVTPATCTENGSKKIVCLECGTEKVETIPALGHNFETETPCSEKCSRCETIKVSHTIGDFHHGVFDKNSDGSFINTIYYKCSNSGCTEILESTDPWFIPLPGQEDSSIENAYRTYKLWEGEQKYNVWINKSEVIYYEDYPNSTLSNLYDKDFILIE